MAGPMHHVGVGVGVGIGIGVEDDGMQDAGCGIDGVPYAPCLDRGRGRSFLIRPPFGGLLMHRISALPQLCQHGDDPVE